MDNLTIQIIPIEVTYQHKDPLPLTCVFKKLVIATNHPLEKYEVKSQPQIRAGKNMFINGPTFALNKQFELQNTKISLDFIVKKQRGVSCIGSAVLDVATLPVQAQSLLDVNLTNCIYPNGKTKLQVKRKQESVQSRRNSKGKPQVMGILQTESQVKQQFMLNRRTNPNIPTAYEISRKNYKQAQILCQETSASKRQRGSVSKGSYQKKFHATNTSINSRLKTQTTKCKEQSPMPREKTPEPIQLINGVKGDRGKEKYERSKSQKYSIGYRKKPQEDQKLQESESLFAKPEYCKVQSRVKRTKESIQTNQNGQSCISYNQLQKQKNNKYMDITQKLQLIQNLILRQNQKKYKSEVESVLSQKESEKSVSQFNYNKYERDAMHQSYDQLSAKNQKHLDKESSISVKYSPIDITNHSPQNDNYTCARQAQANHNKNGMVLSKDKNVYKNTRQTSPAQKSDTVRPTQQKHGDSIMPISYKSKMQIEELQGLNIQLGKQNELLRVKLYDAEQTVKKLMRELSDIFVKSTEKDNQLQAEYQEKSQKANKEIEIKNKEIEIKNKEIENKNKEIENKNKEIENKNQEIEHLSKQVQDFKTRINDQKNLLDKMTKQYQDNLDEIVILKDELESLKKSQTTSTFAFRQKELEQPFKTQREAEQLKQENIKITKKCVQTESTLKLRENEIKHLKIEINNVNAEKKQLEEEINVLARGKKEEMARQKSLAHIQQISNSSLTQLTKRENENLKNEVKILQQKIESFNKMLQSVISKGSINKEALKTIQLPINDKQRLLTKIRQLQEKIGVLQDELRNKKNQFAEIVNIVFSFGDSQLMESVEKKLMQL